MVLSKAQVLGICVFGLMSYAAMADGDSCASFAGNWRGSCVDQHGAPKPPMQLTIEQEKCKSIWIDHVLYVPGGTVTTETKEQDHTLQTTIESVWENANTFKAKNSGIDRDARGATSLSYTMDEEYALLNATLRVQLNGTFDFHDGNAPRSKTLTCVLNRE